MEAKNQFGVKLSEVILGAIVDTTDGDNGVIKMINENEILPYLVEFPNGSAWQDLRHIKKVYNPQQFNV
jgi:uncharacterized protein YkvS